MEDFAEVEPQERRGPRIPLAKLTSIQPNPTITIFYKPNRDSALDLLKTKVSKDAVTVFCNRIHRDLMDTNSKSFTITGGNRQSFKDLFDWIEECVRENKIVHFKTIDESTPGLFLQYANVIEAANYLGIPARDFSEGLQKRLVNIARKVQMTWDEVESFYDKHLDDGLRDVAAASVFYAWWHGKLDEHETPEEMIFLSEMRKRIPELDKDLHNWCEKNEAEVRKRWAEKDANKTATKALEVSHDGGSGEGDAAVQEWFKGGNSHAEAWEETSATRIQPTGDWDEAGKENVNWEQPECIWDNDEITDTQTSAGNWADEVNDSHIVSVAVNQVAW